jgi:DNA-binding transcriptional LysR family regulator
MIDLIQESYDLALRSATLPNSNLIARKLTMLNYVLCATPRYLKIYGKIDHPDQLAQHRFGIFSTGAATQTLELIRGNRSFKITVDGQFQSNQLDLII